MPDRVAKHEQPSALGDPCEHRKRNDRGGGQAGRGLMMFVDHNVETEFIAKRPLVVIAVEQIGRDLEIALDVGEIDAQRAVVIVPGWKVWLLGELIHPHRSISSSAARSALLA